MKSERPSSCTLLAMATTLSAGERLLLQEMLDRLAAAKLQRGLHDVDALAYRLTRG